MRPIFYLPQIYYVNLEVNCYEFKMFLVDLFKIKIIILWIKLAQIFTPSLFTIFLILSLPFTNTLRSISSYNQQHFWLYHSAYHSLIYYGQIATACTLHNFAAHDTYLLLVLLELKDLHNDALMRRNYFHLLLNLDQSHWSTQSSALNQYNQHIDKESLPL